MADPPEPKSSVENLRIETLPAYMQVADATEPLSAWTT